MNLESVGPWVAALGALLGPLSVWGWRIIKRVDKNRDSQYERHIRQEDSLFLRQDKQLDAAYRRIVQLDLQIDLLEKERDRMNQVGWAWYTRANEIRYLLMECRSALPLEHDLKKKELPSIVGFNEIIPPRLSEPRLPPPPLG